MQKTQQYQQLETKLVKYKDLINVCVQENGDDFVELPQVVSGDYGVIGNYENLCDMKGNFPLIPVRKEVKEKLDKVDKELKKMNRNYQLVVAYGYRSLEVQQNYFILQKSNYIKKQGTGKNEDINEIIHRLIAVPSVAGHPTGGAVDVYIQNTETGSPIDFGVPIFTFDSKDVYTFSPFINKESQENRRILRKVMLSQNFAPYDGEWWHFSFGDKEWAFYYQKPHAFYDQKKEGFVLDYIKTKIKERRKIVRTISAQQFYFQ